MGLAPADLKQCLLVSQQKYGVAVSVSRDISTLYSRMVIRHDIVHTYYILFFTCLKNIMEKLVKMGKL